MGRSFSGPLCNQFKSQNRNSCVSRTRPSDLCNGRYVLEGMFAHAFPQFKFILQFLLKIIQEECQIILIASAWSKQTSFIDPMNLSCSRPIQLPLKQDLLSQFKGKAVHSNPDPLPLPGKVSEGKTFLNSNHTYL